MADVVARCPDCGREHPEAFARCDWCGRRDPSRWWCLACGDWRAARACAACAGGLRVPSELNLGEHIAGATVAFRFAVWNLGKWPVDCAVTGDGAALHAPRLSVSPGGTAVVSGELVVPLGPHGRREFRIAFDAPDPCETLITVDAVAPAPQLDFLPALVRLRTANPGGVVRSSVALKNSGNVELTASLAPGAKWLSTEPRRLALDPGASAEIKLIAKSLKTDSGPREATLSATADGAAAVASVHLALPEPQLSAAPVAFGELKPGRPAFADVVIRNTGRVRVNGTVEGAADWLKVVPARVNLQPGREKTVRVRAILTVDDDGPLASELLVSGASGVVLRVPVTAVGVVPRPVLRAVRRQKFRDAIGAPVERKFQVANDGSGRLDLTATADVPWLTIETPELKVAPGKKRRLRYTVDLPNLTRGEHSGTITLESNGGTVPVPVTVLVLDPNPLLEVVAPPDLGMLSPQLPLSVFVQVRNAGIGLMRVRAESESPRVTVYPRELDVPPGPPARFNLSIPVAGLAGGEHEAAVRFTSPGGGGRAVVRFRLPVEQVDVPSLIDLGIREAGAPTGGAVRVRNAGPYPVTLAVRGEQQWLVPGAERITVPPHETTAVAFRVDPPEGSLGPLVCALALEGRAVRHRVAVRLIACRVELVVEPETVDLSDLTPGSERRFAVSVRNVGEIPAVLSSAHVGGELEVWVWRGAVAPGERATLNGAARVNAKRPGQRLLAAVPLGHGLTLQCEANVVAPILPRVTAAAAATGGLIAGAALSVAVGWWLGVPLGLAGMLLGAWLFWREMT